MCVVVVGVLFFQFKCLDIVVLFSQHFLPAPVFKHNYNVYYIYMIVIFCIASCLQYSDRLSIICAFPCLQCSDGGVSVLVL